MAEGDPEHPLPLLPMPGDERLSAGSDALTTAMREPAQAEGQVGLDMSGMERVADRMERAAERMEQAAARMDDALSELGRLG